jgi:membrane protease YdiL (CAAX protease family)
VARLVLREGFADVSFRLSWASGKRALLLAWLFPVGVCVVAYGLTWGAGLAEVNLPSPPFRPATAAPVVQFLIRLGVQLSIGVLVASFFAAGEEIGWRGYMLTRLIDAKVPRPILLGGLVWAVWHFPIILTGQYSSGPSLPASLALFTVNVVAMAYLMARLRLASGSVWPAIVLHGSWNAVIQGVFDAATRGPTLWLGESGIAVAVVTTASVVVLVRGSTAFKRVPNDGEANKTSLLAL